MVGVSVGICLDQHPSPSLRQTFPPLEITRVNMQWSLFLRSELRIITQAFLDFSTTFGHATDFESNFLFFFDGR